MTRACFRLVMRSCGASMFGGESCSFSSMRCLQRCVVLPVGLFLLRWFGLEGSHYAYAARCVRCDWPCICTLCNTSRAGFSWH
mmetsp:Transcript_31773/g.69513  ORF Transcript_31773/g.69513 Transcript_31773/m.69513 type:complete len:83 (-) Transcript_31773:14-262(-)